MPYDPNLHHRRSIRLKGYDYSQSGYYYITLCVKNNDCLFGEIVDHQMNLNDAGKMVEKWVHELGHKYPDIECGEYVVMPNHFHCIIENNGKGNPNMNDNSGIVRANLRVCPDELKEGKHVGLPVQLPDGVLGKHVGLPVQLPDGVLGKHVGSPVQLPDGVLGKHVGLPVQLPDGVLGEHVGSPLRNIIQWFKTMSTNEYIRGVKTMGWKRFDGKLWHINYWEHVIRDQNSFDYISSYILENPKNWHADHLR